MTVQAALVAEPTATKRLYRLTACGAATHLIPKWWEPLREWDEIHVVASMGRSGDSQVFPAREDGSIVDFCSLHGRDYWGTFDDLMDEFLALVNADDRTDAERWEDEVTHFGWAGPIPERRSSGSDS